MDRRRHVDFGGPRMGLLLICFWASLCSGDQSPWFWTRDERPRENHWQCGSIIRPIGGPQPESYRFAFEDLEVDHADLRNEVSRQKQAKKSAELECAVVIVGPSLNSRMVVRVSLLTIPGRDDCRITNALTLYDLQSGRLIIKDTACGKEKMSGVMQTTKNVGLVTVDLGLVRKGSFVITVSVTGTLLNVPAQQINEVPPPMTGPGSGPSSDFNISDSSMTSTTPSANSPESQNSSEPLLPNQELNETTEVTSGEESVTTIGTMEMESESEDSSVNSAHIEMQIDPMPPSEVEEDSDGPPPPVIPSENPPLDGQGNPPEYSEIDSIDSIANNNTQETGSNGEIPVDPMPPSDIEGDSDGPPPLVIPSEDPPLDGQDNPPEYSEIDSIENINTQETGSNGEIPVDPMPPSDIEGDSDGPPPLVIPSEDPPLDGQDNPPEYSEIDSIENINTQETGSNGEIPVDPMPPSDIEEDSDGPPPLVIPAEDPPLDGQENSPGYSEINLTGSKENYNTPETGSNSETVVDPMLSSDTEGYPDDPPSSVIQSENPPDGGQEANSPEYSEMNFSGSKENYDTLGTESNDEIAVEPMVSLDVEGDPDGPPPQAISSENPSGGSENSPEYSEMNFTGSKENYNTPETGSNSETVVDPMLSSDTEGYPDDPPPSVIQSENPPDGGQEANSPEYSEMNFSGSKENYDTLGTESNDEIAVEPMVSLDVEGDPDGPPPQAISSENPSGGGSENSPEYSEMNFTGSKENYNTPVTGSNNEIPADPILSSDLERGPAGLPPRVVPSENPPLDGQEDSPGYSGLNPADFKENCTTLATGSNDLEKPMTLMGGHENKTIIFPEREPNRMTDTTYHESADTNLLSSNYFENGGSFAGPAEEEFPPIPYQLAGSFEDISTLPSSFNSSEKLSPDVDDKTAESSIMIPSKFTENNNASQTGSVDAMPPMEGYGNMALNPVRQQGRPNGFNIETAPSGSMMPLSYDQIITSTMPMGYFEDRPNASITDLNQTGNLESTTHGYENIPVTLFSPIKDEEINISQPEITISNTATQITTAHEATTTNYASLSDVTATYTPPEERVGYTNTPVIPVRDDSTENEDDAESDLNERVSLAVLPSTPITARGLTITASTTELIANEAMTTSAPPVLVTQPFVSDTTLSEDGVQGASTVIPALWVADRGSAVIVKSSEDSMTSDTTSMSEITSQPATTPLPNVDYGIAFTTSSMPFPETSTPYDNFTDGTTGFFTTPATDPTSPVTTTFSGEEVTSTMSSITSIDIRPTEIIMPSTLTSEEWTELEGESLGTTTWGASATNLDELPASKATLIPPESLITTIGWGGTEVNVPADKFTPASSTAHVYASFPHGRDGLDTLTNSSTVQTQASGDNINDRATEREEASGTNGIDNLHGIAVDQLKMTTAPSYDDRTLTATPRDNDLVRTVNF